MSPSSHPSDDQLDAATWCRHLVSDGSVHAEVIATVMVLQALEGLSLSALAADGGTLDCLAGRRRLPAGALPGIEGNNLWWSLRVAAVNLRRLLVLGLTREDGAWVLA